MELAFWKDRGVVKKGILKCFYVGDGWSERIHVQLLPRHRDQGLYLDIYRVMKDGVKVAPQKVLIGEWRNHIGSMLGVRSSGWVVKYLFHGA